MPLSIDNSRQVARAWVNFDGTLTGTITPRASFNVASVTKNGTGDYTVNFVAPMPSANYSAQITGQGNQLGGGNFIGAALHQTAPLSTTSARIVNTALGGSVNSQGDSAIITAAFFGG